MASGIFVYLRACLRMIETDIQKWGFWGHDPQMWQLIRITCDKKVALGPTYEEFCAISLRVTGSQGLNRSWRSKSSGTQIQGGAHFSGLFKCRYNTE